MTSLVWLLLAVYLVGLVATFIVLGLTWIASGGAMRDLWMVVVFSIIWPVFWPAYSAGAFK